MTSQADSQKNDKEPKVIFEAYFDSNGDEVTEKDNYTNGEKHIDYGNGKIARLYLGPKEKTDD